MLSCFLFLICTLVTLSASITGCTHLYMLYVHLIYIVSGHKVLASCIITIQNLLPSQSRSVSRLRRNSWNAVTLIKTLTHSDSAHQHDKLQWKSLLSQDENPSSDLTGAYSALLIKLFIVLSFQNSFVICQVSERFCRWQWIGPSRCVTVAFCKRSSDSSD